MTWCSIGVLSKVFPWRCPKESNILWRWLPKKCLNLILYNYSIYVLKSLVKMYKVCKHWHLINQVQNTWNYCTIAGNSQNRITILNSKTAVMARNFSIVEWHWRHQNQPSRLSVTILKIKMYLLLVEYRPCIISAFHFVICQSIFEISLRSPHAITWYPGMLQNLVLESTVSVVSLNGFQLNKLMCLQISKNLYAFVTQCYPSTLP